jgi:hypothetical protein
MPQLHLYVSDAVAAAVKRKAGAEGKTVSGYLAEVVSRDAQAAAWPPGFFRQVVGKWQGEPRTRVAEGDLEAREDL